MMDLGMIEGLTPFPPSTNKYSIYDNQLVTRACLFDKLPSFLVTIVDNNKSVTCM